MDASLTYKEKEIGTEDSCSESVCVEYDSRSSSHEDIDEYLQCKDTNLMKATERQRQMLKDRNYRTSVVQVPDTFFDHVASIFNRSFKAKKKEERPNRGSASSDESSAGNEYESDSSSGDPLKGASFPCPLEQERQDPLASCSSKFSLGVTNEGTQHNNYVFESQESTKKDTLNEDILDEMLSFVNKCNEDKSLEEHINYKETTRDEIDCNGFRRPQSSKLNTVDRKGVSRSNATRLEKSSCGDQLDKKSRSNGVVNTNCNRKSKSIQPLGKKKQETKFRNNINPKHNRKEENGFLWESKSKVTNRRKCQNEEIASKSKINSTNISLVSSDSDQTVTFESAGDNIMDKSKKASESHKTPLTLKGENGRKETQHAVVAGARTSHILQRNHRSNAEAQFASAENSVKQKKTNRDTDEIRHEKKTVEKKYGGSFDGARKTGVKFPEMNSDNLIKKRQSKREILAKECKSESSVSKSQAPVKINNNERCKRKPLLYLKSNMSCNGIQKDAQNRVPPSIKWGVEPRLEKKRCALKKDRKEKDEEERDGDESEREANGMESENEDGVLPALLDLRAAGDENSSGLRAPSGFCGSSTARRDTSQPVVALPRRAQPTAGKPALPPGKRPFR